MGNSRPADWSPLAGSDPVPGDPPGISAEAAHLSGVAMLIAGQVAQLRKIAAGGTVEKGQHVEKLQSAASDTAGKLDQVVGRYQNTASALTAWVPELEWAQSQSLKALAAAQDAVSRRQANQPVQRPAGTQVSPADQQADQARAVALRQADADLAAARQLLQDAVSYRDQKAGETQRKIESAIDDGVTDGFWDHVSALIHQYAWLLKDIATALEFAATILAIVALFVSGIGLLLLVGLIAGALLLRTILAVNGDGSWSDVALDAISLATLGIGGGVGSVLGKFAENATPVAAKFVQAERSLQALGGMSKLADDPAAAELLGDATPASALKSVLSPLEESGPLQRLLEGGAEDVAASWAKLGRLARMFPDSPFMQGIATDTSVFKMVARFNYLGGLVPDWGDKLAGGFELYGPSPADPVKVGFPWSDAYGHWKDSWFPESSVWGG